MLEDHILSDHVPYGSGMCFISPPYDTYIFARGSLDSLPGRPCTPCLADAMDSGGGRNAYRNCRS